MKLQDYIPHAPARFYAWVGQNASTGRPNPITGNYSMYGSVRAFKYRSDRDQYVADYYDPNGNNFAVAGSFSSLRRFHLGMSVRDYAEHVAYAPELVEIDGELVCV